MEHTSSEETVFGKDCDRVYEEDGDCLSSEMMVRHLEGYSTVEQTAEAEEQHDGDAVASYLTSDPDCAMSYSNQLSLFSCRRYGPRCDCLGEVKLSTSALQYV